VLPAQRGMGSPSRSRRPPLLSAGAFSFFCVRPRRSPTRQLVTSPSHTDTHREDRGP
jgi:hypothetical protein